MAGTWVDADRALDEDGQVIAGARSERRDTAAAPAFVRTAIEHTGVRAETVTTDKAPPSPPALSTIVPEAGHRAGTMEHQGSERDHQHLKGRVRPMGGCHQLRCAEVVCQGHAFARNLEVGVSHLAVPMGDPRLCQPPRLVRAWDDLTLCLRAASSLCLDTLSRSGFIPPTSRQPNGTDPCPYFH